MTNVPRVRTLHVDDEGVDVGEEGLQRPGCAADLEDARSLGQSEAADDLGRDLVPLVLVEGVLEERGVGFGGAHDSNPRTEEPSQTPPSAITPYSSAGVPRSTSKRITRWR